MQHPHSLPPNLWFPVSCNITSFSLNNASNRIHACNHHRGKPTGRKYSKRLKLWPGVGPVSWLLRHSILRCQRPVVTKTASLRKLKGGPSLEQGSLHGVAGGVGETRLCPDTPPPSPVNLPVCQVIGFAFEIIQTWGRVHANSTKISIPLSRFKTMFVFSLLSLFLSPSLTPNFHACVHMHRIVFRLKYICKNFSK